MDDLINALQWPAMAVTLLSAWLVASQSKRKRAAGFWCFLASNVLWVIWGWHDGAIALIALQIGLFAMNLRGALKNDSEGSTTTEAKEPA
jgi:hypothetical protein